MAYTFFPNSVSEIKTELEKNNFPEENIKEIIALYSALRGKMPMVGGKRPSPINIDFSKKSNINVSRVLDGDMTIADIKRRADIKNLILKFGNGSSGNRGANNRGNLFEPQFANALLDWWAGKEISDRNTKNAIDDLNKKYDIESSTTFKVDVVGGQNTPRPLVFSPNIIMSNPTGQGYDIGKAVTDITITLDGGKEIYLSLKLGNTTTFFNSGIRTILTPDEIKSGVIKNANGKALLDIFGIEQEMFCSIFNGWVKQGKAVKPTRYDKAGLQTLLKSGIGFNYHIIHKKTGTIISKQMDKAAMNAGATIVGAPTVYYGGKTGKGKRVDIEFNTQSYKFKVNFRDTQGKDGYPTRMMGDFTYR